LIPAHSYPRKTGFFICAKTKFTRNDFFCKITLAYKQGNDENAWSKRSPQHSGKARLLFPKALKHPRKDTSPPQLIRMLISGCGGIGVQSGPMSHQNEGGILKVLSEHT